MLVEFERFNRVVEKGKYEESYMFKLDNERIYIDFVFVDRELKEIVSNKNFEEVKGLLGEIFKKYWKGERFADITRKEIQKLKEILKLDAKTVGEIFFAE